MATTAKAGSRRANCPLDTNLLRQQRNVLALLVPVIGGVWNGCYVQPAMSINWRASLVPAAAVIPAPVVYTKVVAVKTLVVDSRYWGCRVAH
jgi:hypothetical protein